MYQSYLGRCHKTHLLNWTRPTESDSRVHTDLGHSVTHTTLKTQGLEVAMTGSRGINRQSCPGTGVQEEAQLGRRWHPSVGGRGGACSDSWGADLGEVSRWRMRQAEPAGKGIVWAGGY